MAQRRLAGTARSQAIIEATIGLFAREGFAGATTRRIARAAGVSEALVFRHFPTKEHLYRAILRAKIEEMERLLPLDKTLASLDDEQFFLRIALASLRRVEKDDGFLRLFLRSGLDGHDLAREFSRARSSRVYAFVEDRIRARRSHRRGKHAVDAALASRFFIGMIWSAMLNRHIFADPVMTKASSETLARSIVRTFLDGAGA